MQELRELVNRAQSGDFEAFGRLIAATQTMAYAVARGVLRDAGLAEDAAQEAYLRAFRTISDLEEPGAFVTWLRRIIITVALNMRRAHRVTFLQLEDIPEVPVLDEAETSWSELQRRRLATALLTLTQAERQLCDRRYHGQWSVARLAGAAGVTEPVMRKRLQRVRDKLRKEIEVSEQRDIQPGEIRPDFPARVVELLARPKLTDLPENPVGTVLELLRTVYSDFENFDLAEIIDFESARKTIGDEALYIEPGELHRLDDRRILRYDLTLPLLLSVRYEGRPVRIMAAGKAYRFGQIDAMHLDAFHQAEVFCLDERSRLDPWQVSGLVLRSVDVLLPGRSVRISPTHYAMCSQAWELGVEVDGRWFEVLAWGVFTDKIVRHLGGNPDVHAAIGVGYGLERCAMLRYGIDDIRKIERARVA
jgi:RNA polymerase sigma-70 factor, ECF subfamily